MKEDLTLWCDACAVEIDSKLFERTDIAECPFCGEDSSKTDLGLLQGRREST